METSIIIGAIIFLLIFVVGLIKDFTGISMALMIVFAIISMAIIMHSADTTITAKSFSCIIYLLIFVGGIIKLIKEFPPMGILSIMVLSFPGLPVALCAVKFLFGIDLGCEF